MKLETWMYKQALELYPRAYREQFGQAMLETYSDSLKAAKLEGKALSFHWNTILDTVKSVSRATIDVKNSNPFARVVSFIGLVAILMAFSSSFEQTRGLFSAVVFNWMAAFFMIGIAMISMQMQVFRQRWLLPSFATLVLSKAAIFSFVKLFHADSLNTFYLLEVDLSTNSSIVALGHLFKAIPQIGAGLFAVAMVWDFWQTRKVNFVYLLLITQALSVLLVSVLEKFFPERTFWSFYLIMQAGLVAGIWLFLLFLCLRLWQQPRASQLKLTKP